MASSISFVRRFCESDWMRLIYISKKIIFFLKGGGAGPLGPPSRSATDQGRIGGFDGMKGIRSVKIMHQFKSRAMI